MPANGRKESVLMRWVGLGAVNRWGLYPWICPRQYAAQGDGQAFRSFVSLRFALAFPPRREEKGRIVFLRRCSEGAEVDDPITVPRQVLKPPDNCCGFLSPALVSGIDHRGEDSASSEKFGGGFQRGKG